MSWIDNVWEKERISKTFALFGKNGKNEGAGTRTQDPRLKRPLLYQLSYTPIFHYRVAFLIICKYAETGYIHLLRRGVKGINVNILFLIDKLTSLYIIVVFGSCWAYYV